VHQAQKDVNLMLRQSLAALVDQQVRLASSTIDVRRYQTKLNQMFLQVISDQIFIFPVTQNQEEPDGGTVRQ